MAIVLESMYRYLPPFCSCFSFLFVFKIQRCIENLSAVYYFQKKFHRRCLTEFIPLLLLESMAPLSQAKKLLYLFCKTCTNLWCWIEVLDFNEEINKKKRQKTIKEKSSFSFHFFCNNACQSLVFEREKGIFSTKSVI